MNQQLKDIEKEVVRLGFSLDETQLHIGGERFLMARNKMVLLGTRKEDGIRVVIKYSLNEKGNTEIMSERKIRNMLDSLVFATDTILFPKEILFTTINQLHVFVTEYISQDTVFVAHTLEQQFFMILRAFEAQEVFHANTFEHLKIVKGVFDIFYAKDYFSHVKGYITSIELIYTDNELKHTLERAHEFLLSHKSVIDTYANHLCHSDFVPHNFRIKEKRVYLLDCASIWFGNKYEGWARFLNYMMLHNPELEHILVQYLKDNRSESEYLSLRLMRVYKLIYLIDYHVRSFKDTTGDLHTLTESRIHFWHDALKAVLNDTHLDQEIIDEYIRIRDTLRSKDEKARQREFAIA